VEEADEVAQASAAIMAKAAQIFARSNARTT
jgi:hypothetical protein